MKIEQEIYNKLKNKDIITIEDIKSIDKYFYVCSVLSSHSMYSEYKYFTHETTITIFKNSTEILIDNVIYNIFKNEDELFQLDMINPEVALKYRMIKLLIEKFYFYGDNKLVLAWLNYQYC